MELERWTQIDRHNHQLLAKMDKIMLSRGRVDHLNGYKAKPWLVIGAWHKCGHAKCVCVGLLIQSMHILQYRATIK